MTPLLPSDPQNDYPAILAQAKEYIIAILLETRKRNKQLSIQEIIQLNLFQCLCKVNDNHKVLFYKSSMLQLYKEKCFIYANWVAQKLIQLIQSLEGGQDYSEISQKAKKVQQLSQQKGSNSYEVGFEKNWLDMPEQRIDMMSYESLVD